MMKGKVLILGEDLIVVEDLKDIVEAQGYTVECVVRSEAIENAVKLAPDIIVLDLCQDGLDCIETSRILRNLPAGKTGVIFISGFFSEYFSDTDNHRTVMIKKPFSNVAIVNALGRLENESRASRENRPSKLEQLL